MTQPDTQGGLRRIAYCSPVNPQSSGIADYSEELLPFLGQFVEIDLFVDQGVVPTHADVRRCLPVLRIDTLASRHARHPYDAVVYHMGNSPAHFGLYEQLLRVPGVVVLHDWVLHHLKLGYYARHNQIPRYAAELEQRYGQQGKQVAAQMLRGQLSDAVFRLPLNEDVIAAATGIIGHSHHLIGLVQRQRPQLPCAVVPMGIPELPQMGALEAKRRLGLGDGPLWASFGHINPYKRLEPALRAFRRFREAYGDAHFVMVGSVSAQYDLMRIVAQLELQEAVTVTGFVDAAVFNLYVAAADLCLNLRYPTAGETSASLLRLLAAGRPTLVSAVDAFQELPDDVCCKVDVDRSETALIYHYAHLLTESPVLAALLGQQARRYAATEHSLLGAAGAYMRFLEALYGWEPLKPVRQPLWTVVPPAVASVVAPGQGVQEEIGTSSLIPGVGQALAELGVDENDRPVLRDIAERIDDLLRP
ncbi:MAG: glycosyltransferase family 4 protein [Herpetosiphon sp.]